MMTRADSLIKSAQISDAHLLLATANSVIEKIKQKVSAVKLKREFYWEVKT